MAPAVGGARGDGRRGPVSPYAVKNAAKRRAQDQLDRAREPVIAYYVVPRAIVEAATSWMDLVSAADLSGCRVERLQKREAIGLSVPVDHAVVYEGAPGQVFVARQNW